jgi:hypothetical protein
MNEIPQSSVVAAIRNGTLKRRLSALAKQAPHFASLDRTPEVQDFSADRAVLPFQRPYRGLAGSANWKPGNFDERRTTNTTIGGKEREK